MASFPVPCSRLPRPCPSLSTVHSRSSLFPARAPPSIPCSSPPWKRAGAGAVRGARAPRVRVLVLFRSVWRCKGRMISSPPIIFLFIIIFALLARLFQGVLTAAATRKKKRAGHSDQNLIATIEIFNRYGAYQKFACSRQLLLIVGNKV